MGFGVATGGLFGNTTAKPGGLFGAPAATTGGLFGTAAPATGFGTATGGLFGSTAKPTLNFGSTAAAPAAGGFGTGGLNFGAPAQAAQPTGPLTLNPEAGARAAFQSQLEYVAMTPYGDVLKPLHPLPDTPKPTDPIAHSKIINAAKADSGGGRMKGSGALFDSPRGGSSFMRPTTRIANSPRIFGGLNRSASLRQTPSQQKSLFADLEAETSIMKEGFIPRKNVKKLLLKPKLVVADAQPVRDVVSSPEEEEPPSLLGGDTGASVLASPRPRPPSAAPIRTPVSILKGRLDLNDSSASHNGSIVNESIHGIGAGGDPAAACVTLDEDDEEQRQPTPPPEHPAGLKLTRQDYYTVPSMDELAEMTQDDGSLVVSDGFTVGRIGYGSVFWPGHLSLSGMDLDAVVHFRLKEVTVYPSESEKPAVGSGLNRPAEVTLEGVWPRDKRTGEPVKDAGRLSALGWRGRLEEAARKMDASFLDFRPDSGAWVFRVSHFSKYGLLEDDEPAPTPTADAADCSPKSVQNLVQRSHGATSPGHARTTKVEEASEMEDGEVTLGGESLPPSKAAHQLFQPLRNSSLHNSNELAWGRGAEGGEVDSKLHSILAMSRSLVGSATRGLPDASQSDFHHSLLPSSAAIAAQTAALTQVPGSQSAALALSAASLSDVGLFHGRRFRVGWSPGLGLVELHPQIAFRAVARRVAAAATAKAGLARFLEHQLELATRADDGALPRFAVPHDPKLLPNTLRLLRENKDDLDDGVLQMWELMDVLWGDLKAKEGFTEGIKLSMRKTRLIAWLKAASSKVTKQEASATSSYPRILALLRGGCVAEASAAALDGGDPLLGLLVSAHSAPHTHELIHDMLKQWSQYGVDLTLPEGYLEVCCLLAGCLDWARSDGRQLNLCEGLDWKRALLVHLKYGIADTDHISAGVESYECGVRVSLATPPIAFEDCTDAAYQLVKLYVESRNPVSGLLDPLAFGSDPLDYHKVWMTWVGLRSLGFSAFSAAEESCLHMQFSQALRYRLGLPALALFVLQHIGPPLTRAWAVREAVAAQPLADAADVDVAVSRLGVPEPWLYEAKALRVRRDLATAALAPEEELEQRCKEAWYALKAARPNDAHRLFLANVGPASLLNDGTEQLIRFTQELAKHSARIENWESGGQIYVDYLRLKSALAQIIDNPGATENIKAALVPELRSLVNRLGNVAAGTRLERAGLSEMLRTVVEVVRSVFSRDELAANAALLGSLAQLSQPDAVSFLTSLIADLRPH